MAEIKLRAAEAEQHAAEMRSASSDAADRFAQTRAKLDGLAEAFTGQAADQFEATYQEWDEGARQVVEALDNLGDWLQRASDTLTEVDQQLAGGLGG